MLFEGTGFYFWLLFIIFLIVYVTVRLCFGFLFKRLKQKAWKGYVPIYSTYVLVNFLGLKKFVFYMTLIPFVNLYYYNIIIKKLLEGFGLDPKDSIWYIIIPMYKFPELVFKNPKFKLNEYDLTNQFLEAQNALFNKPKEELPQEISLIDVNKSLEAERNKANGLEPDGSSSQQDSVSVTSNNVYDNQVSDDEKKQVTYVEAVKEEPKEEKPIIQPLDTGKPKLCPNCGTKLSSTATACFMCGHKVN